MGMKTRQLALLIVLVFAGLLAAPPGETATLPPDFALQTYVSGVDDPVGLHWATSSLLYVTEKGGKVRVVQNGTLLTAPFIDLSAEVNKRSDRGLLGITVHPDFPTTAYVYLLYVYDPPETQSQSGRGAPDGSGQRVSRLVRVTADVATGYTTAVAGSEVVILGTASTWANIGDPFAAMEDLTAPTSCGSPGAYISDCIPNDSPQPRDRDRRFRSGRDALHQQR